VCCISTSPLAGEEPELPGREVSSPRSAAEYVAKLGLELGLVASGLVFVLLLQTVENSSVSFPLSTFRDSDGFPSIFINHHSTQVYMMFSETKSTTQKKKNSLVNKPILKQL